MAKYRYTNGPCDVRFIPVNKFIADECVNNNNENTFKQSKYEDTLSSHKITECGMAHSHTHEEGCCSGHLVVAPSTQQTLTELDFERGIWNSAVNGDTHDVKNKIDKGVNVNTKDSSGYSALHYACRNGHKETVELLVENGADVNISTNSGTTPLHRAAYMGHADIVAFLLRKGANPRLCDSDGTTALHKAAEKGHADTCKLILSHCPETKEISDKKGRQPKDCTSSSEVMLLFSG